jgi:hypothetical protein
MVAGMETREQLKEDTKKHNKKVGDLIFQASQAIAAESNPQ